MAIAKPSPLITALSGPVGGSEFFRYGSQIRVAPRRSKCTASTLRAVNARAQHMAAINEWHNLDATERSKYTALAQSMQFPNRFGTPRNITPFQFFLKWYPFCLITYAAHPDPFFDAPVSHYISPGPLTLSLTLNTTPYAEITTTGGLFLFFLSWWHWDIFGPHNKPGLRPKQWQFAANTRMWDYTQDVTSDWTATGIPIIEGATYSIRLRCYAWRNLPSTWAYAEATATAP